MINTINELLWQVFISYLALALSFLCRLFLCKRDAQKFWRGGGQSSHKIQEQHCSQNSRSNHWTMNFVTGVKRECEHVLFSSWQCQNITCSINLWRELILGGNLQQMGIGRGILNSDYLSFSFSIRDKHQGLKYFHLFSILPNSNPNPWDTFRPFGSQKGIVPCPLKQRHRAGLPSPWPLDWRWWEDSAVARKEDAGGIGS